LSDRGKAGYLQPLKRVELIPNSLKPYTNTGARGSKLKRLTARCLVHPGISSLREHKIKVYIVLLYCLYFIAANIEMHDQLWL